ncbi:Protein of unknown function [Variovorax sp. YR750]|uniref:DUF1353 domain-containing protein n=1 Tax=Variovorax gossypii TaxID=1679495 RepID=A0A431TID2_9BURK|nr:MULTISPECIES: DUF1353 domain-containing protein [Variovorax]MDP9604024.1 hypothetical protein [Variovorax paradoxus]RTQ33372.1 DUF1353 domain-containing protein [Variovorax gossypii]SEL03830.1 Protein of unknown function [Variovorax sp. YR750]
MKASGTFFRTLAAAAFCMASAFAQAQFVGDLVLEPAGCTQTGKCKVKNKLRFTDSNKLVWETYDGEPTDGATIPPIFQPIVGKPFEESFLKAAIIHDHYCVRQVRPWRKTHRVFYEGLIDQGVPQAKAKLMYYAVYLGGPKWVKLMPGESCKGNCIKSFKTSDGQPVMRSREADYATVTNEAELAALEQELQANPDGISLEDLEKRAQAKRPDDFYYRNGDQVRMKNLLATE